jgi:CheY-like chemotaxis protein
MNEIAKQILIVDDQPEVGAQIGAYLRQIGFIPVIVTSVEEALTNFEPDRYLLIISDVLMPGKNGFDLVRYIRNEHPQIPVALVSGYFDKQMEDLQKVFGINKIYRKPVFFNSIKQMLADSLKTIAT